MGFLEDIAKNITLKAIAEMSKDKNGKIDPYKAAGIAAGTGNFSSPKDKAMLGAILGSEGAFDDDYNTSYNKEDSHAWRDEYEFDDITSDISPYDYETEEEYKEAKYEWRQFCDYDYEHGIDPEDYETEEEYNEALNEAKYGWRDLCADGSDYGLDPEDYETEDEYNEALQEELSTNQVCCSDDIEYTADLEVNKPEVCGDAIEEIDVSTGNKANSWRETVPNGEEYGLDPFCYDSEQEYLEALNREKYGWREWYTDKENYGLSPEDFETQQEFSKARDAKRKEKQLQEIEKRRQEQLEKRRILEEDKNIYTYCGVLFPSALRPYSYLTKDETIKIGDTVIVPAGNNNEKAQGTVVSVGQYTRLAAPYPVEKTKEIIEKADTITTEESGVWIPYQDKNDSLIKSEEYKEQTRISIYCPGEFAPYEIICGIYGEMFHSVFGNTLEEITEKYEGIKIDLQKYIDSGKQDDDFCSNFTDKW